MRIAKKSPSKKKVVRASEEVTEDKAIDTADVDVAP